MYAALVNVTHAFHDKQEQNILSTYMQPIKIMILAIQSLDFSVYARPVMAPMTIAIE